VLFLSSFEPLSGVTRKNPFAAISAFQHAFPDRSDKRARLVIKLNNFENPVHQSTRPFVEQLARLGADDPRLLVINESLSYPEILELYVSCDVVVSLHRSEGLGLGPLEAMRVGRPVIATGWSGNLSYMSQSNACLVTHRFIPAGGDAHYSAKFLGKPGYWADPSLNEAVQWMQTLVDDPDLRTQIGRHALESTALYQTDAERAGFVDEIRALLEQRRRMPECFGARYLDTRALREAEFAYGLSLMTPQARLLAKVRATLNRHLLWRFR
jgi:glycosyltransferase involved in cell wall biosynthesis